MLVSPGLSSALLETDCPSGPLMEHNHLVSFLALAQHIYSNMPTCFSPLMPSSTIYHGCSGVSASLNVGRGFLQVSKSHAVRILTVSLGVLVRALSPVSWEDASISIYLPLCPTLLSATPSESSLTPISCQYTGASRQSSIRGHPAGKGGGVAFNRKKWVLLQSQGMQENGGIQDFFKASTQMSHPMSQGLTPSQQTCQS